MRKTLIKRKHVVIVCPACGGSGSVASVALHHSHELAKEFDVTLVSDSFPQEKRKDIKNVMIHSWQLNWFRRYAHVPNEVLFLLFTRWAVAGLHKSKRIDLILCNGHGLALFVGAPLYKKYQIPFAMVTHGDIFDRPEGTYDSRLAWFYQKVTPGAYMHSLCVIVISPHMRKMAIKGGANEDRVVIIPHGVDEEEVGLQGKDTELHYKNNECISLLYVGRLSHEKGFDILLRACLLLKNEGIDYELVVAGDGPEEIGYKDFISDKKMGQNVKFIGKINRKDLGEIYLSSHIVCIPSRSEPLSLVVMEAMLAGRAIIASSVGGLPSRITNDETGILVEPENPEDLFRAIKCLGGDLYEMKILGTAARKVASDNYQWHTSGEILVSTINALLNKCKT